MVATSAVALAGAGLKLAASLDVRGRDLILADPYRRLEACSKNLKPPLT
jgi:hypothetical protein